MPAAPAVPAAGVAPAVPRAEYPACDAVRAWASPPEEGPHPCRSPVPEPLRALLPVRSGALHPPGRPAAWACGRGAWVRLPGFPVLLPRSRPPSGALRAGCVQPLQLLPTLLYEKWAKSVYKKAMHNDEAFSDWINAGLRGIATLKSFRQEVWFLNRLKKYRQDVVDAAKKENATATVEDIVTELIQTLLQDGSYLILGLSALKAAIDAAEIPVLLVLSQHMFSSVAYLVQGRDLRYRYQQALAHLDELHSPHRDEDTLESLVLHAEQITKSYGVKQVLQPMSLDIRPGDRILLRGHNGSGKTTLLRILLGLSEPDSGALYRGRQDVAFALQEEPALHVSMKQLAQALAAQGTLSTERFMQHADAFQVSEILERTPEACSAGQRKKFYLSLSLACASDLLVLDEPTNHLDTDSVAYLLRQLEKYSGALLICSHDPRVTMKRVWTMEGGQIHES